MARKAFLIRLDPAVLTAIEGWASDELRSTNAQIEFLLREALRKAGRKPRAGAAPRDSAAEPATPPRPSAVEDAAAEVASPPLARRARR